MKIYFKISKKFINMMHIINTIWYNILKKISPKKKNFKNYTLVNFTLEELKNHYKNLYNIQEEDNNIKYKMFDNSTISDDNLNIIINILKKKKIIQG